MNPYEDKTSLNIFPQYLRVDQHAIIVDSYQILPFQYLLYHY